MIAVSKVVQNAGTEESAVRVCNKVWVMVMSVVSDCPWSAMMLPVPHELEVAVLLT